MKQVTNMSRLVNQLEKTFKLLNQDFFNNELPTPIITVVPTARAYAHYVPVDIWKVGDNEKREINISSASLNRPLVNIVSSLLHEMVHMYNDCILQIQDTSRSGTYHNKQYKTEAEKHGLICKRTDTHGWSYTEPSTDLIEWVSLHNELREIQINRTVCTTATGVGTHTPNNGYIKPIGTNPNSHSIKYICPCCCNSVRATKILNVICGDCMRQMIQA